MAPNVEEPATAAQLPRLRSLDVSYDALHQYRYLILANLPTSDLLLGYLEEVGLLSHTMSRDIREIPQDQIKRRTMRLLNLLGSRIGTPGNLALFCDVLHRSGHQILATFLRGEVRCQPGPSPAEQQSGETAKHVAKQLLNIITEEEKAFAAKRWRLPRTQRLEKPREERSHMTRRLSQRMEDLLSTTYARAVHTLHDLESGHVHETEADHVRQLRNCRQRIQLQDEQIETLTSELGNEKGKTQRLEALLRECHADLDICKKRMLTMSQGGGSMREKDSYLAEIAEEVQNLDVLKSRMEAILGRIESNVNQIDKAEIHEAMQSSAALARRKSEAARHALSNASGQGEFVLPNREPSQRGLSAVIGAEATKEAIESPPARDDSPAAGFRSQVVFLPLAAGIESGIERLIYVIRRLRDKNDRQQEESQQKHRALCSLLDIPSASKDPLGHLSQLLDKVKERTDRVNRRIDIMTRSLSEELVETAKMATRKPSPSQETASQWDILFETLNAVKDEIRLLRSSQHGQAAPLKIPHTPVPAKNTTPRSVLQRSQAEHRDTLQAQRAPMTMSFGLN